MRRIIAIIKPFKLQEVRAALMEVGVKGMSITEVEGFGAQKGHTENYRGAEYAATFLPKVKVEVVVQASLVESVVDAIARSARTAQIGDGKIFVEGIDHAIRIRTGETDDAAL